MKLSATRTVGRFRPAASGLLRRSSAEATQLRSSVRLGSDGSLLRRFMLLLPGCVARTVPMCLHKVRSFYRRRPPSTSLMAVSGGPSSQADNCSAADCACPEATCHDRASLMRLVPRCVAPAIPLVPRPSEMGWATIAPTAISANRLDMSESVVLLS